MLGTVPHAENDDDRKAIAAMTKANEADPNNLGGSPVPGRQPHQRAGPGRSRRSHARRFATSRGSGAWRRSGASALGPGARGCPRVGARGSPSSAPRPPRRDADVHAVLGVLAMTPPRLRRRTRRARCRDARHRRLARVPVEQTRRHAGQQRPSAHAGGVPGEPPTSSQTTFARGATWASRLPTRASTPIASRTTSGRCCLSTRAGGDERWGYLRISLGCCGRIVADGGGRDGRTWSCCARVSAVSEMKRLRRSPNFRDLPPRLPLAHPSQDAWPLGGGFLLLLWAVISPGGDPTRRPGPAPAPAPPPVAAGRAVPLGPVRARSTRPPRPAPPPAASWAAPPSDTARRLSTCPSIRPGAGRVRPCNRAGRTRSRPCDPRARPWSPRASPVSLARPRPELAPGVPPLVRRYSLGSSA